MTENRRIYGNLCRSYVFKWIFSSDIDQQKCLERIKKNFYHFIGDKSIFCEWIAKEEGSQISIEGSFEAIPQKQHRLNISLQNHDCGLFPMGIGPITRVRK